ncbi:MAG: hypothetical protein Q8R91_08845 [Candidatus Omnitrophota bacterium]|nr:hypothetical protein [Candidatus Omnitrophota bacterium]
MPSTPLTFALLGLVSVCFLIITVTGVVVAYEVRQTLRRINRLLPAADQALREAHQAFRQGGRLLLRASEATEQAEAFVRQTYDTASKTLGQVVRLPRQAQRWLSRWMGNGAGAESRLRHRRHQHNRRRAGG